MTKLKELDVNLEKLREFNDAAFHKFSPVCLFTSMEGKESG